MPAKIYNNFIDRRRAQMITENEPVIYSEGKYLYNDTRNKTLTDRKGNVVAREMTPERVAAAVKKAKEYNKENDQ